MTETKEEILSTIERVATFQSGVKAWEKLNEWMKVHTPNAQDGQKMVDALVERIEELEGK